MAYENKPNDANATPVSPPSSQPAPPPAMAHGLHVAVYHRGPYRPQVIGGSHQGLQETVTFLNGPNVTPNYTYLDELAATDLSLIFLGQDGTPTAQFLGARAFGRAEFDTQALESVVVDYRGQLTFATPGVYTFAFHRVDDGAAVYLDGSGAAASGQLLLENYVSNNPVAVDLTVTHTETRAFELIYWNTNFDSVNGAAALSFTIVGPTA